MPEFQSTGGFKFDETQPNVQLDFKKNIFFQMDRVAMLFSMGSPTAYYAVEALEAEVSSWKKFSDDYQTALKDPDKELALKENEIGKLPKEMSYEREEQLTQARLDYAIKKFRLLCAHILQPAIVGDQVTGLADEEP